jgi:hypothetical protein
MALTAPKTYLPLSQVRNVLCSKPTLFAYKSNILIMAICFWAYVLQELMDEVGVYIVSFDRAGYGESDPNPKRSVRSEAFDIQELADQLQLGPRFYILGMSLGTYPIWACLKYIPHRQATL